MYRDLERSKGSVPRDYISRLHVPLGASSLSQDSGAGSVQDVQQWGIASSDAQTHLGTALLAGRTHLAGVQQAAAEGSRHAHAIAGVHQQHVDELERLED